MIWNETYKLLKTQYRDLYQDLTITDVRVGLYITAIRLSDGSCGMAGNQSNEHSHKKERDFSEFTPNRIRGNRVSVLFETDKKSTVVNSLKVAAMNAISSRVIRERGYPVLENTDPVDLLNLEPPKRIAMVGAIQSYIRRLSGTGNMLKVLEFDDNALNEDRREYYVPANMFRNILPDSDIVIITGLTLVNNTIDGLLKVIKPGTEVVVTGPSASIIPDILFENKVTMVGASRVLDPELLFTIVGEGGAGFHLFERCAQKITILNNDVQVERFNLKR